MFLVELVMQGVRGFRELVRLRFQGGFNIVTAANETGKTTAVDSMQRLLFPNSQPGILDSLVSKYAPDASRGALVICSDDGSYYRVIQDFSKRAVNLSKYNVAKKEFGLLHKDWETVGQFLSGLRSGISEEDYARIFVLHRDQYASAPALPAQPSAVFAPHPIPARPTPGGSAKTDAMQERLAELQETLRKAEEAADADYKYQSAKLALEETKKKLTVLETTREKLAEIESTLEALRGCETLPANLSELLESHERLQSQKMVKRDELDKQIEGLQLQVTGIPSVSIIKDKLFMAGMVLAAVSVVAGMSILTAELAYLFLIGLIASVMLMGAAWYNSLRRSTQRSRLNSEMEDLEKERNELEKRFEQESTAITGYMRSTGASTPGDLKEKADNYRYFRSLRDDADEQRQRVLGSTDQQVLQQQYAQQEQEVIALEKEARAVAQYAIDTYSIRQDIERLEAEISAASGDVAWNTGSVTQEPAVVPPPPAPAGKGGFLAELRIASRISGIEMETLVPAVEAAAQRNLAAITAGKYIRIEAGHEGDPVVHVQDDSVVNYADLSHGAKALIYFCLRTGLVEAIAGKRRLPFLLDDPFAGLDPARQKAACQILRTLGAKTQLVLFTSNPALKAEGDAAAEFK